MAFDPVEVLVRDAVAQTGATPAARLVGTDEFVLWSLPSRPGSWPTTEVVNEAIRLVGLKIAKEKYDGRLT